MKTTSAEETKKMAQDLVGRLSGTSVLALYGDLGSGKTTFTQGLAEALGIERRVLSPTFVFIRSYNLENLPFKKFNHVDLYRAASLEDAKSIGIEEVLSDSEALTAIEWPEKIEHLLPPNTIKIKFKKIGENEREITLSTPVLSE